MEWIDPLLAGEARSRVLLTFYAGANRYRRAAMRLSKAWCGLGDFYYALTLTLDDLRQLPNVSSEDWDFVRLHEQQAYGFWLWKPLITDYFARTLPAGTKLAYLDAGCEVNRTGHAADRLEAYWDLASRQAVAAFESSFRATEYTKYDIYRTLKLEPAEDLLQIEATSIFLIAGDASTRFCSEWLLLCRHEDYHLIDDSPSALPQDSSTLQNRYDQSVFSALYSKRNLTPLGRETHFGDGYWRWRSAGRPFPIWASRNTRGLPLYAWRGSLAWVGWVRCEARKMKNKLICLVKVPLRSRH